MTPGKNAYIMTAIAAPNFICVPAPKLNVPIRTAAIITANNRKNSGVE